MLKITFTNGEAKDYEAYKVQDSEDHTQVYLFDTENNVIGVLPKDEIRRIEPGRVAG